VSTARLLRNTVRDQKDWKTVAFKQFHFFDPTGEKFFVLNATKTRGQPNTWYAAITDPNAIEATAATPAEAVAKVWLVTKVP
jgi:hypothetical protein